VVAAVVPETKTAMPVTEEMTMDEANRQECERLAHDLAEFTRRMMPPVRHRPFPTPDRIPYWMIELRHLAEIVRAETGCTAEDAMRAVRALLEALGLPSEGEVTFVFGR